MNTVPQNNEQLRAVVRARYAQSIQNITGGACCADSGTTQSGCCSATNVTVQNGCCDTDCCGSGTTDPISSNLYSPAELAALPVAAALASRGCGNPTALIDLQAGEKVLDLGIGGGIDVLLSGRRVGPTGFVYGLDMTDEMLSLAEQNRVKANIENVQFLKGFIEDIPLPENSVNVIISNCVINLSADKSAVLREAYRVLAPNGRLAISDIVFLGRMPAAIRSDLEAWAGCIAGALEEEVYRSLLREAGFIDIDLEVTRRYSVQDAIENGASTIVASLSDEERASIDGKFVSAFIRARKPS